ncbi:hypothetical protein OH779_00930 [Actinacidiphila glaucinigra]|uniref:hypothetical protein n=1 Tax=Actinacidiphila glaucinigra TaxID=235986 RepID=UPI003865375D
MDLPDDITPAPTTQELPIADYKHLPRIEVEGHVGELGKDEATAVLRYERGHRDRTPIIQLLTSRLRQLRSGEGQSS